MPKKTICRRLKSGVSENAIAEEIQSLPRATTGFWANFVSRKGGISTPVRSQKRSMLETSGSLSCQVKNDVTGVKIAALEVKGNCSPSKHVILSEIAVL